MCRGKSVRHVYKLQCSSVFGKNATLCICKTAVVRVDKSRALCMCTGAGSAVSICKSTGTSVDVCESKFVRIFRLHSCVS